VTSAAVPEDHQALAPMDLRQMHVTVMAAKPEQALATRAEVGAV
jgi:hypothetical protein